MGLWCPNIAGFCVFPFEGTKAGVILLVVHLPRCRRWVLITPRFQQQRRDESLSGFFLSYASASQRSSGSGEMSEDTLHGVSSVTNSIHLATPRPQGCYTSSLSISTVIEGMEREEEVEGCG